MKGNIPAKPVEYKGVQYESIGELARALGIWKTTLSYRLRHGLTPDKNHKKRPCCGMPSIREFARQTGQTANYIINVTMKIKWVCACIVISVKRCVML